MSERSFKELKHRLMTALVLTITMRSGEYVIYNDTSLKGLSCVLMQNRKVVVYALRSWRVIRTTYALELAAIYLLLRFVALSFMERCKIYTDYKSLKYFFT